MGRYSNIGSRTTVKGKPFIRTVKYPNIPLSFEDTYAYTDEGDRFDILAQQYYGDPTLYWIISIANVELKQNSIFIPVGTQIRIPANVASIIAEYNALNSF